MEKRVEYVCEHEKGREKDEIYFRLLSLHVDVIRKSRVFPLYAHNNRCGRASSPMQTQDLGRHLVPLLDKYNLIGICFGSFCRNYHPQLRPKI